MQIALPIAFALFVWWFSTGVILYLDGLPQRTFRWTLAAATGALALAFWGLVGSRADTSALGAYCGFACAVLIWAWQEIAFLLGAITGPRRTALPAGTTGWRRAYFALQAVLHHEIALLGLGIAVYAVAANAPNPTGWWTFLALWAMRQSSKLNVFLGVRNLNESFLPQHLRYLASYFLRRRMNLLFPFSVAAGIAAAVAVVQRASGSPDAGEITALCLTGTMLTLGIVEHGLLVLPIPAQLLWRWGMRSHSAALPAAGEDPLVAPLLK